MGVRARIGRSRLEGGGVRARIGGRRLERGQMTVELAVAMPVLIIVAVIAVNALSFFVDCAVFDRVAHEAVRVYATAPAYGQDAGQSCSLVEQAIVTALDQDNVDVTVEQGSYGFDFNRYTATIVFHPTLFGLGLRSEVFGVPLPTLSHSSTYIVDSYKPGVVV